MHIDNDITTGSTIYRLHALMIAEDQTLIADHEYLAIPVLTMSDYRDDTKDLEVIWTLISIDQNLLTQAGSVTVPADVDPYERLKLAMDQKHHGCMVVKQRNRSEKPPMK